jgi:hypothetical protein
VALSDDQIFYIRDWIGDANPPGDVLLEDMYTRIGSLIGVAHAVLLNRLANFLSEAASYSIIGVYQESSQANIQALRELIKSIEDNFPGVIEDPDALGSLGFHVTRLVRQGRDR